MYFLFLTLSLSLSLSPSLSLSLSLSLPAFSLSPSLSLSLSLFSQVYHINCFCCSTCEKQLAPGEQFGLSKTKLFCKSHYDALQFNGKEYK